MSGLKSQWDAYYEELKEARKSGYRKEKDETLGEKSRMDSIDPKWLQSEGGTDGRD